MKYKIDVVGITWEGYKASYSRIFSEKIAPEQINSKFGDFQRIIDFRITEIEVHYHVEQYKHVTTKTETIISHFADGGYAMYFIPD